jgi:hypothetical protein
MRLLLLKRLQTARTPFQVRIVICIIPVNLLAYILRTDILIIMPGIIVVPERQTLALTVPTFCGTVIVVFLDMFAARQPSRMQIHIVFRRLAIAPFT